MKIYMVHGFMGYGDIIWGFYTDRVAAHKRWTDVMMEKYYELAKERESTREWYSGRHSSSMPEWASMGDEELLKYCSSHYEITELPLDEDIEYTAYIE